MYTSKKWTIWYPYSSQEEWNANIHNILEEVRTQQRHDTDEPYDSEEKDYYTLGCDKYHAWKDDQL
jgi:hypothetical protein